MAIAHHPPSSHLAEGMPWTTRTFPTAPSGAYRRDHSLDRAAPRRAPPEHHTAPARGRSHNGLTWHGPDFIGMLIVIAAAWISLNLLVTAFGYRPIDPPPFSGLGGAVSLISLYMVVLILATQRREYQLAQLREQLTLELAILSEQKTAKVIQLLEETVGIIRSFAIASIKKPRLWLNLLTRNRCCRRSKKPMPKRSRSVVRPTAPRRAFAACFA